MGDDAARKRIEHLFDTREVRPHLTKLLCVALHGTPCATPRTSANLADSIAELRVMAAAATMCWPRPRRRDRVVVCMAPTHVGHELTAAEMLIMAGGSNGTLDYGAGALDTGRLLAGLGDRDTGER
jgi:hypothetical protein